MTQSPPPPTPDMLPKPPKKRLSLIPGTLGWTQILSTFALGLIPTGALWLTLQTDSAQNLWLEAIRTFSTMEPMPKWVPWLVTAMNRQREIFQGALAVETLFLLTGIGLILRWRVARWFALLIYVSGTVGLVYLMQKSTWFVSEIIVPEKSIPQDYQAAANMIGHGLYWATVALAAALGSACLLLLLPHVRREFSPRFQPENTPKS